MSEPHLGTFPQRGLGPQTKLTDARWNPRQERASEADSRPGVGAVGTLRREGVYSGNGARALLQVRPGHEIAGVQQGQQKGQWRRQRFDGPCGDPMGCGGIPACSDPMASGACGNLAAPCDTTACIDPMTCGELSAMPWPAAVPWRLGAP